MTTPISTTPTVLSWWDRMTVEERAAYLTRQQGDARPLDGAEVCDLTEDSTERRAA